MTIQVRSNEKPQSTPSVVEATEKSVQTDTPVEGSLGQLSQSAPDAKEEASEQNKNSSDSETEEKVEEKKEGQEDQNEEKEDQPRKKGGFQRRIDKLNAQKAQAQQELEYWKQLAIKNAGSKTEVNPKVSESASSISDGKPMPDNFETHQEYVEAITDWKVDQKLKKRDQDTQKLNLDQEQSQIVQSYTKRMQTFSEKTHDFQEVLSEVDHISISPALKDIILKSENGPELAYQLAKVPEEYERIAKLPPLACAREIGKFESRLSSSLKTSTEVTQKKITQAPKPIEPVGTGGKGSTPKSISDPNLSQADYEALRREQMKKRRQA